MHEQLDIERWRREFPLEAHDVQIVTQSKTWRTRDPKRFPDQKAVDEWLERRLRPTFRTIIGPSDIAIVEQWREKYEMDSRATTIAPTDLFIWALGEPPDARMTKIGGVPFWPAGSEWPLDEHRDPMQFVAQLCFMDSRDLGLPELPGDILSIFIATDEEGDLRWPYPEAYHFKWLSSVAPNTSDATRFPAFPRPLQSIYGVRHRSRDLDLLQADGDYLPGDEDNFCVESFDGTKIGGLPHWVQGPQEVDGRFIGAIASVQVCHDNRWPFVNTERVDSPRQLDDRLLMIGDMGVINLFLQDDGSVNISADCG